jgi:hypothetical protein
MKKRLFFLAWFFFFCVVSINAQNERKLFQEITLGLIPGITATKNFSEPFSVNCGLLANITVVTPKTYHNFMYGFGNNSLQFLTGYFLPKDWDVYFVYSQEITTANKYLALGAEKMIQAGDVDTFIFFESGTDFKNDPTFTIGILISIQSFIWKR